MNFPLFYKLKSMTEINDNMKTELSHLYRNQLQIITGIIDMQFDFFEKNNVVETKESIQNRVNSIVLLHNDLMNDESPFYVDIQTYLNQLIRHLKFEQPLNFFVVESAPIRSIHVLTFGLIVVEIIEYLKSSQQPLNVLKIEGIKKQKGYEIIIKTVNNLLQTNKEEDVIRIKYLMGLCKQIKAEIFEQDPLIDNEHLELIIRLTI